MRLIIILTVLGLLNSCNNGEINRVSGIEISSATADKPDRRILIEELKRLQSAFATNDKEKIAGIFHFPVVDTAIGIHTTDSSFSAELERNGGMITRAMFIRHYSEISESLQIDQVKELFKNINVDHLLQKDTLEYSVLIKTEPCYYYYSVNVEENMVTLTLGMDENKDYNGKSLAEDEDLSVLCEHVFWWVFRFDGKRLHFNHVTGAG